MIFYIVSPTQNEQHFSDAKFWPPENMHSSNIFPLEEMSLHIYPCICLDKVDVFHVVHLIESMTAKPGGLHS